MLFTTIEHSILFENKVLSVGNKNMASGCLSLGNSTLLHMLLGQIDAEANTESGGRWDSLPQTKLWNADAHTHTLEKKRNEGIPFPPYKDKIRQ